MLIVDFGLLNLEEGEEVSDGHRPELGEGFAFDFEAEGFGLEALSPTGVAGGVGAEAGEEDTDVHLVCFRFQPIEEAFHAIPAAGLPEFLQVFGGGCSTISVVDPFAGVFVEVFPWLADVDAAFLAVADKVALALLAAVALEGFDGSLSDGERGVGDGFFEIDADDASEAAAFRAGSDRGIEGEQGGRGGAEGETGFRVGPTCREGLRDRGFWIVDRGVAFSEVEGGFEGFEEAGFVGGGNFQAVLDDLDDAGDFGGRGGVGADGFAVDENAEVALGAQEGEEFPGFRIGGDRNGEGDEDVRAFQGFRGPFGGGFGGVRADLIAGVRIVAGGEAGEEEFQVIVDLGERADGRAGGADVVFLLDGDGRRDALDGIDERLVHAVEELPDVGRERLHVAALPLGIERVEGERGFPRSGRAGDDGEFPERDVEVEAPQVVLAATTEGDDGGLALFLRLFRHAAD